MFIYQVTLHTSSDQITHNKFIPNLQLSRVQFFTRIYCTCVHACSRLSDSNLLSVNHFTRNLASVLETTKITYVSKRERKCLI